MRRLGVMIAGVLLGAVLGAHYVGADQMMPRNDETLSNAVVKVFVTSNRMDYYRPWQSQGSDPSSGSGVIIEGHRILTNAHVIADHTFIQVKKNLDSRKYTAKVIAAGYDCDLAVLEVDDPAFFDNVVPVKFGGLPNKQDSVMVLGYPQGGGKISVTEGVVSRVEVIPYAQSTRQLLTVQIDAAINPGNSGGPVIKDGLLVGIAMQVFQTGQNIGYMIPIPIIEHFLKDLDDGRYDGFPILGIDLKNTENPSLRAFYGITGEQGGVLVSKILPFSPAAGKLMEGDIVLQINGIPVAEDGTFLFRDDERLSIVHLVTEHYMGQEMTLKVMRDKKIQVIKVKLEKFVPLVAEPFAYKHPPYVIFGGLVFTVLSMDLLGSWGPQWWEQAPLDFGFYAVGAGRLNAGQHKEMVVLLDVLADDINVGYEDAQNDIVLSVNGGKVHSFEEFVKLLNESKKKEPYTTIVTQKNFYIILDNSKIDQVTAEILQRNSIPSPCSDLVCSWLKQKD